jgi:hypothetical protein
MLIWPSVEYAKAVMYALLGQVTAGAALPPDDPPIAVVAPPTFVKTILSTVLA